MKKSNIYGIVTILAMLSMPAAASINFGYAAYTALLDRVNTAVYLATIGGITTGIGFESIGILAGHLSVSYHGRRDGRYKAAAAALVAYIAIGTIELWGIKFAQFVPLLAGLVYLLAGLQYEAVEETAMETAVSQTKFDFQLEEARKDRAAERERKAQAQADKTAVQLARIEAKAKQAESAPKVTKAQPKAPELSGKAQEIYDALVENPGATNTEISEIVSVSRQYVGQVRRELNGALKS